MKKHKVITIVGTRPEIIRLSRVIPKLDEYTDHILVHTGQNSDPMLSDIFFEELELRKPDYYLSIDPSSLGKTLGDVLTKTEQILVEEKPDAVMILGDTNSSIASIVAERMQIPVYHMEAGNRSFDLNVPEETNRRIVDHISAFNLAYTNHARLNLLAEGIQSRRIMVSGSPMREVLEYYRSKIDRSAVLSRLGLEPGEYFLVSAHRQENVDLPERLRLLLNSLSIIHEDFGLPILVSTHPRTRKQLESISGSKATKGITFHEPFGFFDYNNLQLNAKAVISDSGTISEEATILGFPAVTIRDSMERPEALDFGGIVMTGLKSDNILSGIKCAVELAKLKSSNDAPEYPEGYEVRDFSSRVVKFMLSTISRHHDWAGIRRMI